MGADGGSFSVNFSLYIQGGVNTGVLYGGIYVKSILPGGPAAKEGRACRVRNGAELSRGALPLPLSPEQMKASLAWLLAWKRDTLAWPTPIGSYRSQCLQGTLETVR